MEEQQSIAPLRNATLNQPAPSDKAMDVFEEQKTETKWMDGDNNEKVPFFKNMLTTPYSSNGQNKDNPNYNKDDAIIVDNKEMTMKITMMKTKEYTSQKKKNREYTNVGHIPSLLKSLGGELITYT